MTEKEIKEYVTEIRHKADIFRKSGFATAGFATHFDKSADIIEELLPYMAIGTIEEFKALKVENEELHCEIQAINATMDLLENEIRAKAIDGFVSALIPRLTDAIYPQDVASMTNLINDVAEELKAGAE